MRTSGGGMATALAALSALAACTGGEAGDGADSGDAGLVATDTADTADTAGGAGDTADAPWSGPATVCVNEFMPENDGAWVGERRDYPDWIELHNYGTAAVPLDGWSLTDDRAEPGRHVLDGGLVLEPGAFLLLSADAEADLGPTHLSFRLDELGGDVGLYTPAGDGVVVAYGEVEDDFSVARATDCCQGEDCLGFVFRGTPGSTNTPPTTLETTLLPQGSSWAYWATGTAPEGDWTAPGYDAGAWPVSAGPLGFGDGHHATTVPGGPDGARYSAAYFRTTVDVYAVDTLVSVWAEAMRDDGIAIYLNGVEIARGNLPVGTLTYETLATRAVSSSDESAYFTYEADPALLVEGTNTLAVEVHQASATSSDLSFDLRLIGLVPGQ